MNSKQERTIWQQQFNAILRKEEPNELDEFFNILSIVMSSEVNPMLSVMFKILGLEKFVELVNALSGVTIEIPDRHDFQDAIVLALSKYYRDVKHLNWKETRKQIEFDDFAPLRMGKKLSKLDRNIQKEIIEILKKEEEGQDNE